jgi:hypothetical protein
MIRRSGAVRCDDCGLDFRVVLEIGKMGEEPPALWCPRCNSKAIQFSRRRMDRTPLGEAEPREPDEFDPPRE